MPQFNVILNDNAPPAKLEEAKKKAQDAGGKIVSEFELVKGFTVEYPPNQVNVLSSDDNVTVEANSEMSTQ